MAEQGKTILIVDDEPDIREYLETVLQDNGYRTITAGDGQEALDVVEREGLPDLVTLDVSMPEKSGIRFYRDMKEDDARRRVPIVIVTGVDQAFERFISSRRSVPPPEGYLSKPIEQDRLLEMIARLVS